VVRLTPKSRQHDDLALREMQHRPVARMIIVKPSAMRL